jgi:type I restriction enzyme S subunit
MSSEWAMLSLGELADVKHGWAFKSDFFSESPKENPIVVGIGNFKYEGGFRFESTKIKYYEGDFPSDYLLVAGDILLVMTCQTAGGEVLGIPGKIPGDNKKYLHNQRLGKFINKKRDLLDDDYAYNLFKSADFNRFLASSASGTKILHTSPDRILQYSLELPPVSEQKAIAHILGTLDDKIELNRKTNETLEAMAKALFKSWFVDFDPVRAKAEGRPTGLPAEISDLFPD